MTIEAKLICDSISPEGIRLTTMQLRYPRFIHAEFMTHRMFSRNASSSRAIPVAKMIEDLRRDPAMPVYWGSNKPGMQAGEEVDSIHNVTSDWLEAMENAIYKAQKLMASGLHKQISNRILEPWAHINVIVTATDYANFFALRSHPDAQPEIKELSDRMQAVMAESEPSKLGLFQWHLPYILDSDWVDIRTYCKTNRITRDEPQYEEMAAIAVKVSTARCARVSYLTHDGRKTGIEEDIALHDKLVVSTPLHASPAEHQATPDAKRWDAILPEENEWENSYLHGNLRGWQQYRKLLKGEFTQG